ncbi:MAG: hypothetical protein AW07_02305 [Candidatus Accumulibacter sp. SK-11]|nr:MAG: hypothetical protein AW07_02305 [Candidatus Accumulibacter sp. SK-11]
MAGAFSTPVNEASGRAAARGWTMLPMPAPRSRKRRSWYSRVSAESAATVRRLEK